MANSIKGFRFSGEYEDVFEYPSKGEYIYICAEPWAWGYSFTATDYRSNGDGTYSCGSTYPVSIDQIADELVPDYQAPMDVAACHVLDTSGAPDVFEPADGESYADFYGKWQKAFRASGMEAVC